MDRPAIGDVDLVQIDGRRKGSKVLFLPRSRVEIREVVDAKHPVPTPDQRLALARAAAFVDLTHALANSNEFSYRF